MIKDFDIIGFVYFILLSSSSMAMKEGKKLRL